MLYHHKAIIISKTIIKSVRMHRVLKLTTLQLLLLLLMVMEVIITGGGYIVRVNYSDGTSEEYELWGDYGQLFYTDRNGNRSTLRDTSGTYTSFFDSVYNTYLADVGEVDAYTKANFNY